MQMWKEYGIEFLITENINAQSMLLGDRVDARMFLPFRLDHVLPTIDVS